MRIVGYARVSSREQAENSHALEQQIERLKSAGATEILADVESGTKNDRRAFNQVMELVKQGMLDGVVVTRLDRLTRSVVTLRQSLTIFEEAGIPLKALDDSINTGTASGKFHLNILGALAEMEVDRLAERVRHGWTHLRERKVAMNPPFGYIKVNDRHELDHIPFLCLLETKEERSRAAIAREIVDAYLEKKTLRLCLRVINERYGIQTFAHRDQQGEKLGGRTAQQMFRFSPGGLSNWLKNPVLQGHLCYLRGQDRSKKGRTQIIPNTHSDHRLITDEEALQIQAIMSRNAQVRGFGSTALKYPLSGLVYCGECQGACYSCTGKRGKQPGYNYYFQCSNWRPRSCRQKKTIRMEVAEGSVIEALQERLNAIAHIASLPPEQQEPLALKELRQQLAQLEAIPGHNSAIESAKQQLRLQIQTFQLQQTQEDSTKAENRELLMATFGDRTYWNTLPDEEKREIYRALVERVVVREGQVERVELKV